MNAATVSRTLSLIPDRVARTQTGVLFDPNASGTCAHPERIVHLARFLDWLGPLREVTKDDLRIFGLMTPYGKPAIEAAIDDEVDAEGDLELGMEAEPQIDIEATLPAPVEAPREPALT